jgi:hypothetical protein
MRAHPFLIFKLREATIDAKIFGFFNHLRIPVLCSKRHQNEENRLIVFRSERQEITNLRSLYGGALSVW